MNDNPDLSILSQNVDKSQVPPIEQKRMVAFINEFIVSTVSFLNDFMRNVEMKFVEFELKMQRIEASLLIVEAKMASIPDVETKPSPPSDQKDDTPQIMSEQQPQISTETTQDTSSTPNAPNDRTVDESDNTQVEQTDNEQDCVEGVKACDDARYRKYFKMLQFGVPPPAVKMKMQNEGFDPNVLDDPNRILEDGVAFVALEE